MKAENGASSQVKRGLKKQGRSHSGEALGETVFYLNAHGLPPSGEELQDFFL